MHSKNPRAYRWICTNRETAKDAVHNPKFRISEIAFEVSFQSLSQFNRNFQRFAGISPRAYRTSHAGAAISAP